MTNLPAALQTDYADSQVIHATEDDAGGGGVNEWTTAVNTIIGLLGGAGNALALASPTLTSATMTDYTETVQALGTVGSSQTIGALTSGTIVTATLTSATACTFTMPAAAAGKSFVLALRQPASGTATTATFTGVKWAAAGAPTITATVGKCDLLSFICYDGTNWYGTYTQGFTY